jgi:hypothetical protein
VSTRGINVTVTADGKSLKSNKMVNKTRRGFKDPCVYLEKVFKEASNSLLSKYKSSSAYIRLLVKEIVCTPEFIGHETYLMFRPSCLDRAKAIVNLILPFHLGFMMLNRNIDGKYPVTSDLYWAVDMIIKTGTDLLKIGKKNQTIYSYYTEHLQTLIEGCVERETLPERSLLDEYEQVVDKIGKGYEMVVLIPAHLAEISDEDTVTNLQGFIRNLYRAFHVIDDICDRKEDRANERSNFMNFFDSTSEAKEYGLKSLENGYRYLKKVGFHNGHKDYLLWISSDHFKDVIISI